MCATTNYNLRKNVSIIKTLFTRVTKFDIIIEKKFNENIFNRKQ